MVKRSSHRLQHDPNRVIAKPYLPGEEIFTDTGTRAGLLMARILALPEDEVARVLAETVDGFGGRHRGFEALLERHFALVTHRVPDGSGASSSAPTSPTSTPWRGPPSSIHRSCPRPIKLVSARATSDSS